VSIAAKVPKGQTGYGPASQYSSEPLNRPERALSCVRHPEAPRLHQRGEGSRVQRLFALPSPMHTSGFRDGAVRYLRQTDSGASRLRGVGRFKCDHPGQDLMDKMPDEGLIERSLQKQRAVP